MASSVWRLLSIGVFLGARALASPLALRRQTLATRKMTRLLTVPASVDESSSVAMYPDFAIPSSETILTKLNAVNVSLNQVDYIVKNINETARDILIDQVAMGVQNAITMLEGAKSGAKSLEQFGVYDAAQFVNGFVDSFIGFLAEVQAKLGDIHSDIQSRLREIEVGFAKAYYYFMQKFTVALVKVEEFSRLVDTINNTLVNNTAPGFLRNQQHLDVSERSLSADHLTQMKEAIVQANETVQQFELNVLQLNTTAHEMIDTMMNESVAALSQLNDSCVKAIGESNGLPDMLASQIQGVCPKALSVIDTLKAKGDAVAADITPKLDKCVTLVAKLFSAADALALRLYGMVTFVEASKVEEDAIRAAEEIKEKRKEAKEAIIAKNKAAREEAEEEAREEVRDKMAEMKAAKTERHGEIKEHATERKGANSKSKLNREHTRAKENAELVAEETKEERPGNQDLKEIKHPNHANKEVARKRRSAI